MSDAEAVEELAKALNHVESAAESAESRELQEISERAFDHVSDAVQESVKVLGSHGVG